MSTLNHVANSSKNVVDQSVDSSVSKTLVPEVNIDTVTTEAVASTALDLTSSVPEPGNAAAEDSVSTTEAAASTILDALSYVPEQEK